MSPLLRGVLLVAMGFVASMGAVLLWHGPPSTRGILLLAFGVGYPLEIFVIQPWRRRRWIARHEDRDAELEYRITAEVIRTRAKHGSSELAWAAFNQVIQTPEGFWFYQLEQVSIWLPRHGFASEEDFERLSQLAQLHALAFRRIGR